MKIMRGFRILFLLFILILFSCCAFASSQFTDVPDSPLYSRYIQDFYDNNFVAGDTYFGVESGLFRPDDTINRAEFAKITVYTRLAEYFGNAENWSSLPELEMEETIKDKLRYYYRCDNTDIPGCQALSGAGIYGVCNVCETIGGVPFTDVAEKEMDCEVKGMCEPWYTQYVYYAVRKGFIIGYTNADGSRSFRPHDKILRIHALKMLMADDGSTDPENDTRFQRLTALAESRKSYTPKCLKGAENHIRENNGGGDDADRLLKYALLADRLDLFGNSCQVFNEYGATTPEARADFLNYAMTRKEAPRYYALTTSYSPVSADPADDATLNSADENALSPAGGTGYEIPDRGSSSAVKSTSLDYSHLMDNFKLNDIPEKSPVLTGSPRRYGAKGTVITGINTPDTFNIPKPVKAASATGAVLSSGTVSMPYSSSSYGSTAGMTACMKTERLCETPSAERCVSIMPGKVTAVGDVEYGQKCAYTSLWQKVSYRGKSYYAPYDELDFNCVTQPAVSAAPKTFSPSLYQTPYTIPSAAKTTAPQITITVPGGNTSGQSGGLLGDIWGGITGWFSEKHVEGVKQAVFGVIDLGVGVIEIAGGITIAGAGTAGTAGIGSVPAVAGGAVVAGLGVNNAVSGITGLWSGLQNILNNETDTDIHYDQFNPISEGIDSVTQEGSAENIVLHVTHIGVDIIAVGGAGKALAEIESGTVALQGGSATSKVQKYAEIESIFKNPEQLAGKTPDEIDALFKNKNNWKLDVMQKSESNPGGGRVYRELTSDGKLTDRMIQWHPGGGHHGVEAYWKISSGETGIIRIGPQFPE
jgi:hypothetical protein